MKTPSEEFAALTAEMEHLKSKIVVLKREAEKAGLPPDNAQMYEIEHKLFILGSRVEMLSHRV